MSDQPEAMELSPVEAVALAHRIIVDLLTDPDPEWLSWELVPMLSEEAFDLLRGEIAKYAEQAAGVSDAYDRYRRIDSRILLERAS